MPIPHPFPYQGSKRRIASQILAHFPRDVDRLIEPFCGSAAVSIATAWEWRANRFWINDANDALMMLWSMILEHPRQLSEEYRRMWHEQLDDPDAYFYDVRDRFNADPQPSWFLYLLARIVKGSIRYSSSGRFNQSPDRRRLGMNPDTMAMQISDTSNLLSGRCRATCSDFREVVEFAGGYDLIYMDPPYQGTSETGDPRYHRGLPFDEFVQALDDMNRRDLSYIVSYDGWTGEKQHGSLLPPELGLTRVSIEAGRSTQSTLLGGADRTIESLYLSAQARQRANVEVGPLVFAGRS